MDNIPLISPDTELIAQLMVNPQLRREITRQSHYWFFHIYFSRHVTYKTADFQKEMFGLTQDNKNEMIVITGFRACAKTTIMVESYPIWAIIGVHQKKNVLIICRTVEQARKRLGNIKSELENNKILARDLGPFKEEPPNDPWSASTLVIPKYNARISAVSFEQNIRGTKSGPDRPDLVILDDIDDLNSVRTLESRDKTYDWLMGDIFPLGDKGTQYVIIGNLLHEDSMIMRIKRKIVGCEIKNAVYREYPIVQDGKILWPGKYPTMADVEKENRGDEAAFQREYFLKIIPKQKVIYEEWVQYYDKLPSDDNLVEIATAIDPACTTKESSDYTAMVSFKIYSIKDEYYIYVLPNPIHTKMEHPELIKTAKKISKSLGNGIPTILYVENVAYQKAIAQDLQRDGYLAEEVGLAGLDKESRLKLTSNKIKDGHILFPKQGCEELIKEIVNFGATEHDDLVDAFSLGVIQLSSFQKPFEPEIYFISPHYRR